MPMIAEVDKPISQEAIRRKKLKKWTNALGLCACPECSSIEVAHVTIVNEGEKLICVVCKHEEVVAPEERTIRRGLRL